MTLRDRPDPGPRCDPADVEMWEQLQRALTKLDQAEQRAELLSSERDDLDKLAGILEGERDRFEDRLLDEQQAKGDQQARAEQAEAQRNALAEALRELAGEYGCTLLEPADPSLPPVDREPCRDERPDQRQTWCYACIARSALDALDQTNREGIQ